MPLAHAVALEAVLVAALLLAHLAVPPELLEAFGFDSVRDCLRRQEIVLAHGGFGGGGAEIFGGFRVLGFMIWGILGIGGLYIKPRSSLLLLFSNEIVFFFPKKEIWDEFQNIIGFGSDPLHTILNCRNILWMIRIYYTPF